MFSFFFALVGPVGMAAIVRVRIIRPYLVILLYFSFSYDCESTLSFKFYSEILDFIIF